MGDVIPATDLHLQLKYDFDLLEKLIASGCKFTICGKQKNAILEWADSANDQTLANLRAKLRGGNLPALITGERSGYDILDIDPRNGGDVWWAENSHLFANCPTYRTRSGGLHVVILHRRGLRNSANKIAPGVDVRADGGISVLWVACGYGWVVDRPANAWPPEVLELALAAAPAHHGAGSQAIAAVSVSDETKADLYSALRWISAEGYDEWFKVLMALKSIERPNDNYWAYNLAMEWSAQSAKFEFEDFLKKWRSLSPRSFNHAWIFAEATKNGWQNPGYGNAASFVHASIADDEWNNASPTPKVIVETILHADVSVVVAPGGVGKTTLMLWECVHIILGRPLYGYAVVTPGPVLIISAEDSREQIIARTRAICMGLGLNADEVTKIRQHLFIEYVGGSSFRLCKIGSDVVETSDNVGMIVDHYAGKNLSMLVIDPAVSFGVGESRVNDAEQGLIVAARRLRDALGCCVRLIHHTGKTTDRDDQYAGRGGSTMPDGARMVTVLQPLDANDFGKQTGAPLSSLGTGLKLTFAKLTYSPKQPPVFIERINFTYRHVKPVKADPEARKVENVDKVYQFLLTEFRAGKHYSKALLEAEAPRIGVGRTEIRDALHRLELDIRIRVDSVSGRGQGKRIVPLEYSPPVLASNPQSAENCMAAS